MEQPERQNGSGWHVMFNYHYHKMDSNLYIYNKKLRNMPMSIPGVDSRSKNLKCSSRKVDCLPSGDKGSKLTAYLFSSFVSFRTTP